MSPQNTEMKLNEILAVVLRSLLCQNNCLFNASSIARGERGWLIGVKKLKCSKFWRDCSPKKNLILKK